MSEIMTNFRAIDMPGAAKPKPKAVQTPKPVVAPAPVVVAEPTPVVVAEPAPAVFEPVAVTEEPSATE